MSREIRLVLKVDQEGNLTARLKDTAAQAENTEGKLKKASETAKKADAELGNEVEKTNRKLKERSKLGGGAAGGGKPSAIEQVLQGRAGGDANKLLGGAGKAAVVIGAYIAVTQALGKVGDAAAVLGNSSLSASQKMNLLAESFIPGAAAVKRFIEGITGVTEALRFQGQEHQVRMGVLGAWTAGERTKDAARSRRDAGMAAVGSMADLPAAGADLKGLAPGVAARGYAPLQKFDRSTAEGQRLYDEYQRKLPAMDAQTRANRAADAARREVNMGGSRVENLNSLQQQARDRRDAARRKERDLFNAENQTGGTMSVRYKAERDKLLKTAAEENQQVMDLEARKQTEINGLAEARVRLAQAEGAARKANVAVMQAELENLKARESAMAGQAQKFGMMGAGGRMQALMAFKSVQAMGIENAPPELLSQAAAFAPKTIAKQAEKAGEQTEEFKAGKALAPEDFGGGKDTLDQIRAQIDKVQTDVRISIDLDERATAKEIADALQDTFKKLIQTIKLTIKDTEIKIRTEQGIANNMQG